MWLITRIIWKNITQKWHIGTQGGAPKDEYDKLKKEKSELEDEYEKIDKERKMINNLINQTNGIAKKENQIVTNYNGTVE